MTNPIQLLEEKLQEIKDAEKLCEEARNYDDMDLVGHYRKMYMVSLYVLQEYLKKHKIKL